MSTANQQHSLLVRALWYVVVGWWATGIWLGVAWILNLSIVGLPVGIKMINEVPKVLTLKKKSESEFITQQGGDQPSLAIRAVYFVLVGWWGSGLWIVLAYVLSLTVVGLPVAIWMYNKLPYVTSLYKY